MAAKQCSLRILMFPWLGHAHVFQFLELARKLSCKKFQIYFYSTPVNLDSIRKSLKKDSSDKDDHFSIQLIELLLPCLPELPPHYHTPKNVPPHLTATLMRAFQMSRPSFSNMITTLKPDLLIYDGFQPWSAKIASAQGIPPVLFATSSSTSLSFFHHMYIHRSFDTFPSQGIWIGEYEQRSLMAQGESIEVEDQGEGIAYGIFQLSCDIVLIKSCRGIEGKYMDYLSKLCNKKVVPAGPLITSDQENSDSEIMNWLSRRRRGSTLYISFGSENYLSEVQMREIGRGLEVSDVNFIWVARSPVGSDADVEEALPEGFLERVRERGILVQGWAPQAAILAHASVGGFMSHCGWSSVTESMYFGVPLLAVPLNSDQPLNARLVAEAGVGVEVVRDQNGGFDGEGVAKAVNEVFGEEKGGGMRKKAREMSEKMKMEEEEAMNEVAEELSRICLKK